MFRIIQCMLVEGEASFVDHDNGEIKFTKMIDELDFELQWIFKPEKLPSKTFSNLVVQELAETTAHLLNYSVKIALEFCTHVQYA